MGRESDRREESDIDPARKPKCDIDPGRKLNVTRQDSQGVMKEYDIDRGKEVKAS